MYQGVPDSHSHTCRNAEGQSLERRRHSPSMHSSARPRRLTSALTRPPARKGPPTLAILLDVACA
eukprot:363798-Chlamydomonas_euryale.AAC.1